MAAAKPRNLPGLTGLRGIGALWVFLFHACWGLNIPIIRDGYLGVEIFFVLSGFVLCHANRNLFEGGFYFQSYMSFLKFRLARIYPMHLFGLILVGLVLAFEPDFVHGFPYQPDRFSTKTFIASLLLVQNWGFGLPGGWNAPAWSLSAEWFASLAFPIVILVAVSTQSVRYLLTLAAGSLAAFAMVILATSQTAPDVSGKLGLVRVICEFSTGCFLYYAQFYGWKPNKLTIILAISAMVIGLLFPQFVLICLFPIAISIVSAAHSGNMLSSILSNSIFQFFGKISYSFYIMHHIILLQSYRIKYLWHPIANEKSYWTALPIVFVFTVGCSYITYRFVEIPAQRWGRKLFRSYSTSDATPQNIV